MEYIHKMAHLSQDKLYRYTLTRQWRCHTYGVPGGVVHTHRGCILWIMLNPSTADAELDDPTIRKVVGFSSRWDYGQAAIANLFAFRTKSPQELVQFNGDIIGPQTDYWIHLLIRYYDIHSVVCAWGANTHPRVRTRVPRVIDLLKQHNLRLMCLGEEGEPAHPLYIPYERELVELKKW